MKRKIFSLVALLAAFTASAQVSPITGSSQINSGSIVYALPTTSLRIKVTAVKETFISGPYSQYAQKYLGIEAPQADKDNYQIKQIEVTTQNEADLTQLYNLQTGAKSTQANFLSFAAEGLVLNANAFETGNVMNKVPVNSSRDAAFNDMGVEPIIAQTAATFYNTVRTDSGFVKVPVQRAQLTEKNLEKRAEEAANTIFNLRKKRVDLITGEIPEAFTGGSLKAALDEIYRLEQEYLSLFIGKSYADTQVNYFTVTPDKNSTSNSYIAFRFSDTQGALPENNLSGRPVMLELTPEGKTSALNDVRFSADAKSKQSYIFYRIPESVRIKLVDGKTILLQDRVSLYQLGALLSVPADIQLK